MEHRPYLAAAVVDLDQDPGWAHWVLSLAVAVDRELFARVAAVHHEPLEGADHLGRPEVVAPAKAKPMVANRS